MTCQKRQKIVKRNSNGVEEFHRCLNDKCDAFGHIVEDATCAGCPLAVSKHKGLRGPVPKTAPCTDCGPYKKALVDAGPEAPELPTLTMQAVLYKQALTKWIKAGRPTRTQEEVEAIHKNHCLPCSWYDAEKKRCNGCGCKVTDNSVAVFNKIKMATEHCPREIW